MSDKNIIEKIDTVTRQRKALFPSEQLIDIRQHGASQEQRQED